MQELNWYNDKKFIISSVIPIAVSLVALGVSSSVYKQTIRLNEAKVIIPLVGVSVVVDTSYSCPEQKKELNFTNDPPCWEIVNPTLKNIGNANARAIQLEMIGCFLDESINFKDVLYPTNLQHYTGNCAKYWDDGLVSELSPASEFARFGDSYIPYFFKKDGKTKALLGEVVILIFNLNYIDALTGKSRSSVSFYRYQIGSGFFEHTVEEPAASHLLISTYKIMYPRLIEELKIATASDELIKYVKENSPEVLRR